jgi:hypothetical protein
MLAAWLLGIPAPREPAEAIGINEMDRARDFNERASLAAP